MLTLIKNEFIKLFKRPKTIVLLVLFFLAAAGCTFIAYKGAKSWEEYNSIDNEIRYTEENIKRQDEFITIKKDSLKSSTDKEEKKVLKEDIEYAEQELKSYKSELKSLKKEKESPTPWQVKAEKDIKSSKADIIELKRQLKSLEETTIIRLEDKEIQKNQLLSEIASAKDFIVRTQDSLDKNIESIQSGSQLLVGNLIMNFSMILSLAIPLFIAIFGSDIVSDEATNETFKFLLIQPVSRGKILMSKFITLLTTMLTLIIGTQAVIYLSTGFATGFEHLKLLHRVGIEYEFDALALKEYGQKIATEIPGSGYYITLGEMSTQVMLFQILFIIVGCAFVFMISTLCKSNMISMAMSTVVLAGGAILPMFIPQVGQYWNLSFLGYNNPYKLVSGDIAVMYNNINYNTEAGMIIMIVSIFVLLAIAHINFNKKDILV